MTSLTINGKEFEAKCNFLFDRTADKKYGAPNEKTGVPEGGFSAIYSGLLEFDTNALFQFWVCGLAHYHKQGPTELQIEAALEARIEEDGDVLPAIQEAFNTIDESGFFKRKAASFWKNVDLMNEIGSEDEEEKKQMDLANRVLKEARNTLKGIETE